MPRRVGRALCRIPCHSSLAPSRAGILGGGNEGPGAFNLFEFNTLDKCSYESSDTVSRAAALRSALALVSAASAALGRVLHMWPTGERFRKPRQRVSSRAVQEHPQHGGQRRARHHHPGRVPGRPNERLAHLEQHVLQLHDVRHLHLPACFRRAAGLALLLAVLLLACWPAGLLALALPRDLPAPPLLPYLDALPVLLLRI